MELSSSIISTAILIFFVIDPFGNVPILLSVLKDVDDSRQGRVIIRETVIGLAILLVFLFFGGNFLNLFHLQTESVTIAGGVIFFVIGLKMIFPSGDSSNVFGSTGEPFVVPVAMPMIAGPSALATLLVMTKSGRHTMTELTGALLIAWAASALILYSSPLLFKLLRKRGLQAMERLIGMLLLIMSVQMFIDGIRGFLRTM